MGSCSKPIPNCVFGFSTLNKFSSVILAYQSPPKRATKSNLA